LSKVLDTWGRSPTLVASDVLILGTEAAGSRAAIAAREAGAEVVTVSKAYRGRSGATICAPSDYACDSRSLTGLGCRGTNPSDDVALFRADIMRSGRQLSFPTLAQLLAEQAATRLRDLVEFGARLGRVFHYPGHEFPRSVSIGDVGETGVRLMKALMNRANAVGVKTYEACAVFELVLTDGIVSGAAGVDLSSGDLVIFQAKAVVMATGGASQLFKLSTAPEESTGDGMAMAYRAGAELIDMEMVQFIPYAQLTPRAMRGMTFLGGELLNLLEGHLLNADGERFMGRYQPEHMERTTRDRLSIAIAKEIAAGRGSERGGVFVSLSHLDDRDLIAFLEDMFPKGRIENFDLREFGFDPTQHFLELAPAAHYWCGGILVNDKCETNIPGLYAAGEAVGGVHGANRLSGCSLTDTQVLGALAGFQAAKWAEGRERHPRQGGLEHLRERIAVLLATGDDSVSSVRRAIREVAHQGLGVLREGTTLQRVVNQSKELKSQAEGVHLRTRKLRGNVELIRALENLNMIDVLEMMANGAVERKESRGTHFRMDFPRSDLQASHTVVRRSGARVSCWLS
jgi:fumarate reductase (CoM/CoB) subunit A